jgi:outer membrane receptor protein involved in Fe transport
LSNAVSLQASTYRSSRTPSLNELHRGFRVGNAVTNPNPLLDPERLTGVEGGVLVTQGKVSARATAFLNQLDGAITNVTLSTTPSLITRERQNTDTVRAAGLEVEADFRPSRRWTVGAVAVVTRSRFANTPKQPALEGNRVPQVPRFQLGGTLTYVDRGFTGSVQSRVLGSQFDDDLNQFELARYSVTDISASQQVLRRLNVFVAVENLFDKDYDTGRTPLRTIGWPRSARAGVRVFLP